MPHISGAKVPIDHLRRRPCVLQQRRGISTGLASAVHSSRATAQTPAPVRRYAATGDIVLDGVSFAYPSRSKADVLENVSLRIRHGSITALVGRSGAGKSTIAALISRFYTPDAGLITMGGIDVHAWSRRAWSEAVAMVAQDPVLFAASVADNIAYGRTRATRAEVVAAAEAANAHEFIEALEHGCFPLAALSLPSHCPVTALSSRCYQHEFIEALEHGCFSALLLPSASKRSITCVRNNAHELMAALEHGCCPVPMASLFTDCLVNGKHIENNQNSVLLSRSEVQRTELPLQHSSFFAGTTPSSARPATG